MSDILPTPPEARPLPFRRPADYYSAPLSEVRPLFPRWVPFGCGAASIVAVLILFVAGALAASGKGGVLFATIFGTMTDELRNTFTKDVTAPQKKAFDAEMKALAKNLEDGKVPMDRLQPVLRAVREAAADNRVTPDEVEKLTKAAHEANEVAPLRGSAVSPSVHPATSQPRNRATP